MVFHVLRLDGPERARADVEEDLGPSDAPRGQAREEGGREVETGRGSRDASLFPRVDRLVAFGVLGTVSPPDVGGERGVARTGGGPWRGRPLLDSRWTRRRASAPNDGDVMVIEQVVVDSHGVPDAEPPAGADEGFPGSGSGSGRRRRTSAAPPFRRTPEEPGGNDPAPVDDEKVPGGEELGEVPEGVVADGSGPPVEDEEAGGVALGKGLLGDELLGEGVVELGDVHG